MDAAVMQVLVAYASRNGSTRDVAEAVAQALRTQGAQVELRLARQVREPVADRDLVVLGAPIYSGRWHTDAHRFAKRHRADLEAIPVAVFGMGPRNDTGEAWQQARGQLDRALAKRSWLHPVAIAVFGGVDPPGRRPSPGRDLRDWDAIRAWAQSLPATLPRQAES
jgi:menaquinone-dependent protoporphyrinogen oxidase